MASEQNIDMIGATKTQQIRNLRKLYEMIEQMHMEDDNPILSTYKACISEVCSGLTLMDMVEQGAEIHWVADVSELRKGLPKGYGVAIMKDGSCDVHILFKGEATL